MNLPKFNRKLATAIAFSGIGAAAFVAAGFPLPMLLGPMAGCLAAALAGARMEGAGHLGTFMRTFLGVAIGASVTPELLGRIPELALSLSLVPILVAAVGGIGYLFFRRVVGFDAMTSYYAALPGGMQEMILFGAEEGGNIRAISLVHATRVLVIFACVPFIATHYFGLNLDQPPGEPAASLPWHETALMIVSGLTGWRIAHAMRIPGASIIGPMLLTALLSLAGVVNSRPPLEMMLVAQFFIGLGVGVRYTGITLGELRLDVIAGLGYCVLASAACIALILAAGNFLAADFLDVLLAFLPGGQAEMAMIAIVAGTDVAYVVAHHLVRIFFVITVGKWISGYLK